MGAWPIVKANRFVADDVSFSTYSKTLTPHASANTKSIYTELVASAPFDVAGIVIECQIAGASFQLMDIAVGAAASEQIIIPNVLVGTTATGTHVILHKFIPIFIPAGSRIAVRFQSTNSSAYFHLKMQMLAQSFAGFGPPSRWIDWGSNLATSKGTTITAGSPGNTKGSYIQLVAASDFTTRWIILSIGDGTVDDVAVDIAVGAAASEQIIISDFYVTNEAVTPYLLLPWSIPGGSRIAARCGSGGASSVVRVHLLGGA